MRVRTSSPECRWWFLFVCMMVRFGAPQNSWVRPFVSYDWLWLLNYITICTLVECTCKPTSHTYADAGTRVFFRWLVLCKCYNKHIINRYIITCSFDWCTDTSLEQWERATPLQRLYGNARADYCVLDTWWIWIWTTTQQSRINVRKSVL